MFPGWRDHFGCGSGPTMHKQIRDSLVRTIIAHIDLLFFTCACSEPRIEHETWLANNDTSKYMHAWRVALYMTHIQHCASQLPNSAIIVLCAHACRVSIVSLLCSLRCSVRCLVRCSLRCGAVRVACVLVSVCACVVCLIVFECV